MRHININSIRRYRTFAFIINPKHERRFLDTAYHPDFGQPVGYQFESLPEHPDGQVSKTMSRVIEYIRKDASSPIIQQEARRCIERGDGNPIKGVWDLCKSSMRFKHDSDIANDLQSSDPRINDVVEVLIRPADQAMLIALQGMGVEDCDGYEMFAGCLLHALGFRCALVTVSADSSEPYRFSHVYLACYVDGQRIPIDFSHGPYPGWECPNTGRMREWPIWVTWQEKAMNTLSPIAVVVGAYLALHYANRRAA